GGLDQLAQGACAVRRLQIQRNALLAAIELEEEGADAVDERSPSARVVAVRGLFDLQHLGAHVAEHHRGERPGNDARQVDDADSIQWRHAAFYRFGTIDAGSSARCHAATCASAHEATKWRLEFSATHVSGSRRTAISQDRIHDGTKAHAADERAVTGASLARH